MRCMLHYPKDDPRNAPAGTSKDRAGGSSPGSLLGRVRKGGMPQELWALEAPPFPSMIPDCHESCLSGTSPSSTGEIMTLTCIIKRKSPQRPSLVLELR